jgi:1-acyl-sn-glycerol-3-phosphate acyltransferase
MVASTGRVPPFGYDASPLASLEEIRKRSNRPVVVFPECTTSNGRALLKFANVFDDIKKVPVKAFGVFVMCVRCDIVNRGQREMRIDLTFEDMMPLRIFLRRLLSQYHLLHHHRGYY